jgi:hypothetical protein
MNWLLGSWRRPCAPGEALGEAVGAYKKHLGKHLGKCDGPYGPSPDLLTGHYAYYYIRPSFSPFSCV